MIHYNMAKLNPITRKTTNILTEMRNQLYVYKYLHYKEKLNSFLTFIFEAVWHCSLENFIIIHSMKYYYASQSDTSLLEDIRRRQ
jgi:hypothetical protein